MSFTNYQLGCSLHEFFTSVSDALTNKKNGYVDSQGYNFCVYDDLQAVGVENAADVHVELVKLVDGLSCAHVPQHAVVENQVVRGVEGGAVPLVVVGQVWVVQRQRHLTRLDVIDLGGREEISIQADIHSAFCCTTRWIQT